MQTHRRKCCVIFSRRVVKILINKKSAIWRIFYFLDDQNNAHNHPMPVHRNNQLPKRTRIISFLLRPFWRASHAGARIIANTIAIDTMYFITSKNSNGVFICSFVYMPYFAALPNSSSIRNNWLYFAMRSVRDIEPVLI